MARKMDTSIPDSTLVYISLSSSAAVYILLGLISLPNSKLPLLAGIFVLTNMISRTSTFQGPMRRAVLAAAKHLQRFGLFLAKSRVSQSGNSRFSALNQVSQNELLEALVSLRDYASNSKVSNVRRRKLFKMMSWRQQKLCDDAGYSLKLNLIDTHIDKNQRVFSQIVKATEASYGLSGHEYSALLSRNRPASQNTSSSNYRVIESLGHLVRDWSPSGEAEIAPMLKYIKQQLDRVVLPENAPKTCIVVPGSGLGRVAHEVALHKQYGAVHAVEFSGLMHACNQSIYQPELKTENRIFPYIHTTSNFLDTKVQFRETEVPVGLQQPANLHLHLDDFRYFSIPEKEEYDTVVVVSAFFIDTAENILDYFDQINQLAVPSKKIAAQRTDAQKLGTSKSALKNGFWINYGPLKYGSAAQAELNATEIAHIRKNLGWVDIHALNTIEDPASEFAKGIVPGTGLNGYITDKQSLWQGYYGISMWTSGKRANQLKG